MTVSFVSRNLESYRDWPGRLKLVMFSATELLLGLLYICGIIADWACIRDL